LKGGGTVKTAKEREDFLERPAKACVVGEKGGVSIPPSRLQGGGGLPFLKSEDYLGKKEAETKCFLLLVRRKELTLHLIAEKGAE